MSTVRFLPRGSGDEHVYQGVTSRSLEGGVRVGQ